MRLLLTLLALCAIAGAQDFRATITGQVSDASGSAIPGATVRATQKSTGVATETKTNQEGYFTLPYLQPSTYDVEVTSEGFNRALRQNVTLMVAEKLDIPFTLELGQVNQTVTVTAEAAELQTSDASGGMNFDSLQTSEYPLNGRQVYMLMDLAPGVLFTQEQFGVTGFSGTRGWDTNGEYVMNGGVKGTNSFTLNGAPISMTGSWQVAPNVDAIQEFKIMTNTYDASIGRTGGGSVNTTLKSGSNAVHGTLFHYHRNAILDANYTQNNRVGAPRGKHITHQFGGTIGGPIRKEKDFYFASLEVFRERVPFPVVANTPPMDIRDGQHFSQYRVNVFDPLTSRPCEPGIDTASITTQCSSPYIREPFPRNVIPPARMNPIGVKILALYPAPNMPGTTQNHVASNNTGKYKYDQPMVRYDRMISNATRFTSTVTFQHGEEYRNQNGFPGIAAVGNIHSQRTNLNGIVNVTRVISPSLFLDFRASFGRFTSFFPDGELEAEENVESLGMTKMPRAPTSRFKAPPRIQVDQYNDIIGNQFTWYSDNQWNFVPTLTWIKGTMNIRFGFDMVYAIRARAESGRANGLFNFGRQYTQQYPLRGGNTSDGSGIGALLLGHPASGYIDYNDTYYRTWPYYGFFVQQDWKIRRNLTLNLGLRWDVQMPFVERHDRINSGFDFKAKNPYSDAVLARWRELKIAYDAANPRFLYPDPPEVLLGGKTFINPGDNRRTYEIDWQNIQPRLGFAWQFERKTVMRGGFGIYHRTATQGNTTDGFNQRTDYIESLDGLLTPSAGLTGPYSLEDPFPSGIIAPSGRELGFATNVGRAVSFDGRQRLIPRTFQYSFGLQRRVWKVLLDGSYVGSLTNHDTMALDVNYLPWNVFMAGQKVPNFLDRTVPNPFYGIIPENATNGASATIAARELYRSFPMFQGITINTNPWSRYRYDSLQLRAEKRFFGNRHAVGALTAVFSYTFSKNFEIAKRLNNWNLDEEPIKQLVSYDKPQNIAFSGVWDLPMGRGRHFYKQPARWADPVISGWTVNWIYRFVSGNPVAKPNTMFLCDSYLTSRQTPDRWFNSDPTCYRSLPGYTLRTAEDRFGNLRQMDMPSLNISMAKRFLLTENWKLFFKAEAFNVTNTPFFGAPEVNYQNVRFGMLPLGQQNFPRNIQVSGRIEF